MIFPMKPLLLAVTLASTTDGRQLRSLASTGNEAGAEAAVIGSGFSVYEDPSSVAEASASNENHHANIFASTGAEEELGATRTTAGTTTVGATKTSSSKGSKSSKSAKAAKSRKVEPVPPAVDFCPEQATTTQQQSASSSFHAHDKRPRQSARESRRKKHTKSGSPGNHTPTKKTKRDRHKMGYNESANEKQMETQRVLKGRGKPTRPNGKKKKKKNAPVLPATNTPTTSPSPGPSAEPSQGPTSPIAEEIMEKEVKPLIVGGQDVDPPRKYPFFAWYNGCAGSLIAPNLILSAAHCESVAVDGIITMGIHDLAVDEDSLDEFTNIEQIPIKNLVVHPCYVPSSDDNDFMIIELEYPTTMYLENIVELDTPDDNGVDLVDGLSLTVVGFGVLFSSPNFSVSPDTLQEVDVDFDSTCGEYSPSEITENMLCAGSLGLDACQDDSGGPIIDTATQTQVGVVSFGTGCGREGFPGVYSRVSAAIDWIEYVMAEKAGENTSPAPAPAEDTIQGWFDSLGDGCLFYANNLDACQNAAPFANGGKDANEVCAVCAAIDHIAQINGSEEQGTAKFAVNFLYDGEYEAAVHGLVPAEIIPDTVPVGADFNSNLHRLEISDVAAFRVALPLGTSADFIDLDLFVYDPNGNVVGSSETGGREIVDIITPMDGTWTVEVFIFDKIFNGNRYEGDYDLYVWKIPTTPSDDAGFSIISAPETATRGASGEVEFRYPTDLSEDEWFLGAVSHTGNGILRSVTLLTFDSNVEFVTLINTTAFEFYEGTNGQNSFTATFGYTGDYMAEALPLVGGTLNTGSLDAFSDFAAFEFELIGQAYFQAQLPSVVNDLSSEGLDMLIIDPNGQIVGESVNDIIDQYIELVFPEDGIYSVYIYVAFFDNPEIDYSLVTWKLPMESSGTNLVVESSPKSATSGETEDIEVSWNGLTTGNGPEHYVIGAVLHTGEDDVKVLTTVEIDNWSP